jgi:hypothetical protein
MSKQVAAKRRLRLVVLIGKNYVAPNGESGGLDRLGCGSGHRTPMDANCAEIAVETRLHIASRRGIKWFTRVL